MNFLADFTKAANIEAWSRYPKSDGGGQGVRLGFKAGAEWAHDHLAAQEPTDAEVIAALAAAAQVRLMRHGQQYRVRVSCRDCTGEDPEGCFGGGYGWIEVREHPAEGGVYRVDDSGISPSRAAIFPDMNTAEDARAEVESNDCWAGPWDTEIVDQAGNAVPASDYTPSGRPLPSDHADRHGVQHGSQEATR